MRHSIPLLLTRVLFCGAAALQAAGLDLIKDGVPQAAIWFTDGQPPETPRAPTDRQAAEDLAATLKQISGAELALKTLEKEGKPDAGTAAIIVGDLARQMGLTPPPKTPSGDGYRIQLKGQHLLLGGENADSTFFATSHLLETFGCRWFIDNEIGTVIPALKTVHVDAIDIAEQPDFISRSLWGPNWRGSGWVKHNRLGGMALSSGHNWPNWLCTTDPQVRANYLSNVVERIKGKGVVSASISPPDGVNYCKCDRCKALDIPDYLEPSSGTPVMSDRYQEFYNYIAREAKKVNPQAILCHYAYADYTLPPKRVAGGLDNLCVSLAPIRFCRVHSLSNPICEPRQRCREMVLGWTKVEQKLVWREYNYNLAELTVPFSKISIWKEDIPWLKAQGCIGLNIECLYTPHIYGPHTYLVARMAWDADLDVAAVMDDFYTKFCGPAAPPIKAYWERIDKAYATTPVHAGSFHGVHAFWTPELLAACQADLTAAAKAAGQDELIARRVAMFQMGLDNAKFYIAWREAVNRCDFAASQKLYDQLIAHMDATHAAKIHPIGEYKRGYVPRFLGGGQASGLARVSDGRQLVLQLPDEWLFKYDPAAVGESNGWHKAAAAEADGWQKVKTYSATLNEQKIPEQLTWMWYQTTIKTPKTLPDGPLTLWFMEPDGNEMSVWLDGQPLAQSGYIKSRQPLDVDITGKLKADTEHTVTLKLYHRRISELLLGGLLRPAMIYSGAAPLPPPAPDKKK
jgi:hypothetical protein